MPPRLRIYVDLDQDAVESINAYAEVLFPEFRNGRERQRAAIARIIHEWAAARLTGGSTLTGEARRLKATSTINHLP
jgi:hypothetical protein